MPFSWTTAEIDAIARLALYNGNPYNAATNPRGLANGGHRVVFAPSLNDASTAAGAIKKAADYVSQQADAAGQGASDAAAYAARMSGTSTTAVVIGSGDKSFTTQAGKFFEVGRTLRIASAANPNSAYMIGKVKAYSGTALTVTVQLFVGTGSPADWQILVDGELGPSGTIAISGATVLAPDQAPTVTNSGTASAAILAFGIPRGRDAGLFYRWSTDAAATDPTTGKVKVNSASLTAATFLYISEIDANAVAQSAVLASWDDSTNPVRGQIRIEDIANPANFVVYNVTGNLTDNGAWDAIPVAYVDKGGTLAANASVRVEVLRAGDKGSPGANGNDGAAATVTVRTTSTGAAGSAATVTNAGTAAAAVLDFVVPRGATGSTGPVVATRYNFDTVTTDADPGNGNVRFNNAAPGSTTLIYLDNVEATGGTAMTGFIDTFDDSTNPSGKGVLTFKDVNDQSRFAIFTVTGAVVDGSGYRKVPVTWLAGAGGFTAGANLGMSFDRAGDKGADGGGAGNVVGPSTATDGGFALFSGTTGKLLQSGQVPGALAYKASINNNDWSGAVLTIGNGGTGAATVSAAQTNLNLVPGTHVQAYSAKLQGLADLTWAASKGIYLTSATALATYDLTAFGRSLSGAADASAAQATLQLVPGTNVQAYSANLQAIAGLTGAANKLAYFTGAGAFSLADFSIYGRTLVATADAAGARSALGLGTAATAGTGTTAGTIALLQTGGVFDPATQPQITGGDVTAPAGSAVHTIANGAVSNAKRANMAANTLSGNNAGAAASPADLTVSQVKALLAYALSELTGTLQATQFPALTGAITTTAGSLATALSDGAVTFAKLAAAAIASAASDVWTNAASKVATIAGLWASLAPVDWGSISGTYTPSLSAFLNAKASLSASLTLANPTNVKGGEAGEILFTMGAANLTISYGSAWKSLGATPTAPTASGAQCVLSYRVFDATNIVFTLTKVGA